MHCKQAMRYEGVIYVAGHPLLNRRFTRFPGCIRLRNYYRHCVGWDVEHMNFNIIITAGLGVTLSTSPSTILFDV